MTVCTGTYYYICWQLFLVIEYITKPYYIFMPGVASWIYLLIKDIQGM